MTPHSIAAELTRRGIKSPGGKDKWNQGTVRRMLSNEKYKGDALLQKEFTVDFLTKKLKKNEETTKPSSAPPFSIWCRPSWSAESEAQAPVTAE